MIKQVATFVRQVYQGKTIRRIVFNEWLAKQVPTFHGVVLDLGAGTKGAYADLLPSDSTVIATDIKEGPGLRRVDLNEPLPFDDGTFDVVTLFFTLYILEDRVATLREIHRVMKKGAKLYVTTPLIAAEIPEPHDYCRLTAEGIERESRQAGFDVAHIYRMGGRATSAAVILHPLFVFNTVRLVVFVVARTIDKLFVKRDAAHPVPHTYLCVLEK